MITFAGIILATWVIARFLSTLLGRLLRHGTPFVAVYVRRLVWVIIWLLGIIFALEQVGLRVDLLLLIVGLFGAVLVVANAETLRNIASKYFSDVYIPLKVGDSIKVREYSGKVIEINPLSTILLADNEELISIPNYIFLREPVLNITPHAWKEVTVPIVLDSEIDLAEFESEILRSCNKLKLHLDERFPPILTVKNKDQRAWDLVLTLMVKEASRKEAIVSDINSKVGEIVERMRREV